MIPYFLPFDAQGDLFEGTEVHGREEGGWLRLDPASWRKIFWSGSDLVINLEKLNAFSSLKQM